MGVAERVFGGQIEPEFFDRLVSRQALVIAFLGGVIAIVTPLFGGWFSFPWDVAYVSLILLCVAVISLFVFGRFHVEKMDEAESEKEELKNEKEELKDEIDEREEFYSLIDEKNTSPVELDYKNLNVEISDGAADNVVYEMGISALEGHELDIYYALIGTDKGVSWDDLDVNPVGGHVHDYRRRDYEKFTRFVVEFRLDHMITSGDTYKFEFSLEHDVVDPDENAAYLLVREPTDSLGLHIVFPEGWEPNRRVAKYREKTEGSKRNESETSLPRPDKTQNEDEKWCIDWRCSSCQWGQAYQVDWTASYDEA